MNQGWTSGEEDRIWGVERGLMINRGRGCTMTGWPRSVALVDLSMPVAYRSLSVHLHLLLSSVFCVLLPYNNGRAQVWSLREGEILSQRFTVPHLPNSRMPTRLQRHGQPHHRTWRQRPDGCQQ